jgi:hypothetical protein
MTLNAASSVAYPVLLTLWQVFKDLIYFANVFESKSLGDYTFSIGGDSRPLIVINYAGAGQSWHSMRW